MPGSGGTTQPNLLLAHIRVFRPYFHDLYDMDYSADSTPPPELNEETALLAQLDQTDLEEGRVSHGDHYHYTRTSARKRNAAGKPHPKGIYYCV